MRTGDDIICGHAQLRRALRSRHNRKIPSVSNCWRSQLPGRGLCRAIAQCEQARAAPQWPLTRIDPPPSVARRSNPLATKAATTALLNLLGDVICQLGIEKGQFDFKRSAIFTFLGGVLVGPTLHFWCGASQLSPAREPLATLQCLPPECLLGRPTHHHARLTARKSLPQVL